MMAERAIARDACDALLEKSIRHCPEVARDISHQPGLQKSETRGGAGRSRPAEGQVSGGVAMLPVQTCRQPSCFHAKAAQAPFVLDSAPGGMLYGAGLLWPHPTFQLCPHPRGQLYEEPSGETGATVAGDKHTPTVLVGNSATQARTQRTGAGYSVEDVRQQTHIRPATLDSVCWSAARVCKGSGHKRAAFGREYASTTSRPPGAPLNVTVNVWAPLTCTCVLKADAVQPHLRVREHGGRAMDGRVHRRGSTVRTSMVPVPERIRKYAELGQESTLHSPKFLLTPRCDILKQVKKRHDSKHNKQSRGPRQGVVPARCVKCQCGKSGVLGVPRQSEGDLRRVKCHRKKPLLCPWATGPVLEPGAAFAQCVKCHRGETSWWGMPRQSEGDLRRVKCHRGKPLLCLWVSGTVLGPGAVLPQCVKCHCGETFWWGVPRQSEGDSRCVKRHREKSVLCPWATGPVLGSGAVLAQCVKCHCGETFWWGVPRQSEGDSRCVKCYREKSVLCPWATGPVLGSGAVLAQCVKCHCGETFWWGVPRQSEGDSRCVKCHRGKSILCPWTTGPVLGSGAVLAQCVKCYWGETCWWEVPRQSESVVSLRCVSVSVRVGISASVSISISMIASVSVSVRVRVSIGVSTIVSVSTSASASRSVSVSFSVSISDRVCVHDKKRVAGNGESPGLRGILVYGHEPDAEINAQGGRDGHKKVRI